MNVQNSGDVSLERASFSECTAGEWDGGGMFVEYSGDVSLKGASFSKCTAGMVRLPRPHTLASPAHARSHAIAAAGSGRRRQRGIGVAKPARFPQRAALGLARPLSLPDALPA